MIGSTRQWVTKMLDSLEKQGAIKKLAGFIAISELETLKRSID
jgi:hypothetical protein